MGQRLSFWIFLGAVGLAAFFVLRPSTDFNAGSPIDYSRATVEGKTVELAERLGFSVDSLNMMTTRTQHLNYYRALKDSLGEELPTPHDLNSRGLNLNGWDVTIAAQLNNDDELAVTKKEIFDKSGRIKLLYDNENRVRRITANADNPEVNPTFVPGDSLSAIANSLVGDILNYDLSKYTLRNVDVQDSVMGAGEPGYNPETLNLGGDDNQDNTIFQFSWSKADMNHDGPGELQLELKPMIKEVDGGQGPSIKYGASVESFQAKEAYEVEQLEGSSPFNNLAIITFFLSLGLLIFLVFFSGILNINRGHVEWKRALFILVCIFLGILGWRAIYFMNMLDPFLGNTATTVFILNQFLLAAAVGLYGALAYIGWEAVARTQNMYQLQLLDAFWRKRFFFKETGEGLLRGYALGGVLLGIFALAVFLLDTVFYQSDSQFGYAEAALHPKLLTINMSAWVNSWLVALGHVGVVVGLLQTYLKRGWHIYSVGIILLGVLFAGSASQVSVEGPVGYDILIYTLMAPVIIYSFQKAGILTFSTGWWMFVITILFLPYLGSESMDVGYIVWIQAFVVLAPLLFGIFAFIYGMPVADIGGYVPEYQERIDKHLRVEKEIEIARDSQFKLMPLQPPAIQGVDVYGFFMPSFEVGGDYFDYVVSRNGASEPEALVMTIADVSGKAMKAAMHAVFTSGLLLSRLHRDPPDAILREVAPTIYTRTDPQTFITCIIAQYNLHSRVLNIANAGHCLPILKRNGKAEFIRTPEPRYPLGIRNEVGYTLQETTLKEGDFVFLYSDGLPEAVDPEGNRFGFDRLIELVENLETETKPSSEIALDVKRRVQKFSDYQLADDTTIICLKV